MEDLYIGIEFAKGTDEVKKLLSVIQRKTNEVLPQDSGIGIKLISETGARRIVKFSFEYAVANGRKKVSAVHKANIMKLADGLFLDCFREIAEGYPDIEATDSIVDAACMRLVMDPHQFDVVVMENLYGDILSDLCAGLVGGLGVTPGANIGAGVAVFEAVHGSAPDIAGKGIANPVGMILSTAMMFRYSLARPDVATRIERAVERAIEAGHRTPDLGGKATSAGLTDAILRELRQ